VKKTGWFFLGGFFLAAGTLRAAGVAASWLQIPSSARQAAMAGALSVLSEDLDALGANPAGLADLSGNQAGFLHNMWVQGLNLEHLAYGHGFGDSGFALGGDYLDFGQVDFYGLGGSGNPVSNGSFHPGGLDLYAGYGLEPLPGLRFGADGKFIQENLVGGSGSSTAAADLGVQYWNFPTDLEFGASLVNLGGDLEGAALPLALDLAGAYRPRWGSDRLSLGGALDWAFQDPQGTTASLGGEYWYRGNLALRAGYRWAAYGNLAGLAGLSAGVGVRWQGAELDYAWTTLGDLGSSNLISLSYRFGPFRAPLLPSPGGLTYHYGKDETVVTWNPIHVEGAAGYDFYIEKPTDKKFKLATPKPIHDTNVHLKNMHQGEVYQVGVATVNSDGRAGPMVSITLEPPDVQVTQ
jgi:Uncharacterised protein family (UPF0164)